MKKIPWVAGGVGKGPETEVMDCDLREDLETVNFTDILDNKANAAGWRGLAGGAVMLLLCGCAPDLKVGPGAVLFVGDSLTSGHGLPGNARLYPEILGETWGRDVVNLSESGLRAGEAGKKFGGEIDKIGEGEVAAAFLVLGANDQLTGRGAGETARDLDEVATRMKRKGWQVFIVQSIVPLRSAGYREAYESVAEKIGTPVSSDIVGAYLRKPGGTSGDGVHPSEEGHAMIAETLHRDYGKIMGGGKP